VKIYRFATSWWITRASRPAKNGALIVQQLDEEEAAPTYAPDILLVHAALSRFAKKYPRQAQVVELRFFGGLTAEETVRTMVLSG
jgi:hypothetical protein